MFFKMDERLGSCSDKTFLVPCAKKKRLQKIMTVWAECVRLPTQQSCFSERFIVISFKLLLLTCPLNLAFTGVFFLVNFCYFLPYIMAATSQLLFFAAVTNTDKGCCSCRDPTQRFSSNSGKLLLATYYSQIQSLKKFHR